MKLKIIETDLTGAKGWLFKLIDESGNEVYIMELWFYKKNKLKTPVNYTVTDSYDNNMWIDANIQEIDGKKIVTSINFNRGIKR